MPRKRFRKFLSIPHYNISIGRHNTNDISSNGGFAKISPVKNGRLSAITWVREKGKAEKAICMSKGSWFQRRNGKKKRLETASFQNGRNTLKVYELFLYRAKNWNWCENLQLQAPKCQSVCLSVALHPQFWTLSQSRTFLGFDIGQS